MGAIVEMEEQSQEEYPIYVCPFCGKEAPSGLDHPVCLLR